MKPTIESIMLNQLNHIHADVIMTAYSQNDQGWAEYNTEPDFYRFVYVDKGKGWLQWNNHTHIAQSGRLYLLPAGKQSFGTEGDELFGRYWCHFRMELADRQFVESQQLPLYVDVKDERLLKGLFAKLIELQHSDTLTRELRMKAVLLELLAYYFDESYVQKENIDEAGLDVEWNEVLDYIERQLHRNIQIEELAKVAFLHPNYFITSFKSMIGCSPIQYVTNRRLTIAKQLLVETSEPISEIARKVGMQNHYLSRLFKRYTGISPIQYRRIAKINAPSMHAAEPFYTYRDEEDASL